MELNTLYGSTMPVNKSIHCDNFQTIFLLSVSLAREKSKTKQKKNSNKPGNCGYEHLIMLVTVACKIPVPIIHNYAANLFSAVIFNFCYSKCSIVNDAIDFIIAS